VATACLSLTLAAAACHDATGPLGGRTIDIVQVQDSVFEGDSLRLAARVLDETGVEVAGAPVAWTISDTTVARLVGADVLALLRPGTVHISARSGIAEAGHDLAIGRLVVQRVELTPGTIDMGRTDRVQVAVRVLGQGDREVRGRAIMFSSDDTLVAVVGGGGSMDAPPIGFLVAVGAGSTTIRAGVDGVTGTAQVGVVLADSVYALAEYTGFPVPVLAEVDTLVADGVPRLYEVHAETGALVLSGLLQRRYELDVTYSVYQVVGTEGAAERQFIMRVRGQFDRGLVATGTDGSLSMVSEIIGPRLEHVATPAVGGYMVRYRIPGEGTFLDLGYVRVEPS